MIEQPALDICRVWSDGSKASGMELKLLVPGGWTMRVPSITVTDDFATAYIQWFMQEGMSTEKAEQAAKAAVQGPFNYGFRMSLNHSIFHFAEEYAKMYPKRIYPAQGQIRTFILQGYRPEVMQMYHVPGTVYGTVGLPAARKALMEMGNDAA